MGRVWIKTCGLSYEMPLLFSSSSPLFWKRRPFLRPPFRPLFPHPHLRTRERTRPCASRTQRVRNSYLHPSPSPAIHWYSVFCAWRKCPFFAFTGEGNRGETFTRKSLFPSRLQSYGEEVKAKNEKQRTRALRVRVGGWGGRQEHFRKGLLVVGGALQVEDEPKDGSVQQKISHQAKTKVWNIKSSVLQKDCLILHLPVDSTP